VCVCVCVLALLKHAPKFVAPINVLCKQCKKHDFGTY
jgi:hypothetical protein